jgi:hypothetical protein
MMNTRVVVICVMGLFFCSAVEAQDVDPKKAYDEFRKKAIDDYNDFRSQANARYAQFLTESWKSFKTLPAIPKPKDKEVPPIKFDDKRKDSLKGGPIPYDTIVQPIVAPIPPQPVAPIPEVVQPQENVVQYDFYGARYKIRFPSDGSFSLNDIGSQTIADMWSKLSEPKYNNLICDCLDARQRLNLCDWAYLQLLDSVSKACVGSGNSAILLKDFIFCQSGYQCRMGCCNGQLIMLVATSSDIYERPFIKIEGEHFFIIDSNANTLDICTAAFPGEKELSLLVGKEQRFGGNCTEMRRLTSARYPDVKVDVQTNKRLLDFYATYPQSQVGKDGGSRFVFFANTPLSLTATKSLYPSLKSYIDGKNQFDAANLLLNFVQMAFAYEYDEKVWGRDRAFFADETLFYPYCDCEDRSILFSRLIRDLMHLDVVFLFYPGHLATAVNFTDDVKGDYLMVNGKRYVVCDPTFIGADVGRTMTGMDNQKAEVIVLDKSH